MGKFWTQVTVSKGLPPDMRHLKPKVKRKGLSHRTIDNSSVVSVTGMRVPSERRLGVLSYGIYSCNHCGDMSHLGAWSDLCVEKVRRRLNDNDGDAKGRVLFLIGEDWFRKQACLGVLTFHLPRAGTVKVLHVETALGTASEKRAHVVMALLLCAQRIARESGGGASSRLEWTVRNASRARDISERYGFHEQTRDRDGYHLARVVDFAAVELPGA